MSEQFNWDDCDIEGACRVLEANGYLLTATRLQRIPGRMAELSAAIADSQAYNQQLIGKLVKMQNENNQLQARLDAAMARIADLEQTILYLTAQDTERIEQLQPTQYTEIECFNCQTMNEVPVGHAEAWYCCYCSMDVMKLDPHFSKFYPPKDDHLVQQASDFSFAEHTENILCPNCNHVEQATVLHTTPWYSYVHDCSACGHTIMESEWQIVEQMIQERAKE